jgi:3-dehydroquinate dehydratase-2
MAARILVLNGPNLNMLGTREPEIYGRQSLADVEAACAERGRALGLEVECRQSNGEGELVGWIQDALGVFDGLIINGGAYTHTSIAILDALGAVDLPVIEVHITNIYQRDEFRRHSYISMAARGVIAGCGTYGYQLALDALARMLDPTA